MDSFIWLLAQTEQKGQAAPKNYIMYRQSPVPSEDRALGAAVARTYYEHRQKMPLTLALISWQDIVGDVK